MEQWTFVAAADMQPGSPRSFRYRPDLIENWRTAREQIVEIHPDLMLVPGDITRDGSIHRFEFEEMKRDFDALPFPCYAVPGNMDTGNKHADCDGPPSPLREKDTRLSISSEQLKNYSEFFGPLYWTTVHKNVRFSGCCDMLCGSGLPEEEEFLRWLESADRWPKMRFHVWTMHYALFMESPEEESFDITNPAQYKDWYFCVDKPHRERFMDAFRKTGVTHVITGHIHCRRHVVFEGIQFDYAPSVAFSQYGDRWPDGDDTLGFLRYDVHEDRIDRGFVPLAKVSDAKGQYGPGGHPPPSARDYSLAWEPPPPG